MSVHNKQEGGKCEVPLTALQLFHNNSRRKKNGSEPNNLSLQTDQNAVSMPIPLLLPPSKSGTSDKSTNHDNDWLTLGQKHIGSITELSGEGGTGKTQFLLSLCLTTALLQTDTLNTNVGHSAVENKRPRDFDESQVLSNQQQKKRHISEFQQSILPEAHHESIEFCEALFVSMGESTSSSQIAHRLHQMAAARSEEIPSSQSSPSTIRQVMERVHTRIIHNTEEFIDLIAELPHILKYGLNQGNGQNVTNKKSRSNIRLVVLDSIAGLYRMDDSVQSDKFFYMKRSEELFGISAKLKRISKDFGVHIIITNQVTTTLEGNVSTGVWNPIDGKVPSLGLSWSCCVNERYFLSRKEISMGDSTRFARRLHLLASSHSEQGKNVEIQIETKGVSSKL
ncbi:hypothetical protein CTEN210_17405 [Chaetoceros tenuissimus]|uniref:Rad51-like C-terminal domain-containing protein n=1 Tax=Chaetoceros tenuissimus TaxID=426638 RepID=A0AAD3DE11_9STRA|nr:hypothetical protein CTEN210_17405 [Chaetoceros tenuissimus]